MWIQVTSILLLIVFCVSFVGAESYIKLTEDNGTFSSPQDRETAISSIHLIRTRPNRKVALRFDVLELDSEDSDFVSVRDGRRSSVHYLYKRNSDGRIHLTIEDTEEQYQERESRVVKEPVRFDSSTGRVFVSYYTRNSRNKNGFRATYETYPNDMCRVDDLTTFDTAPSCDQITMAKVATRCSHTLRCQTNYRTYGEAVCSNGIWTDNAECLPDETVVEQCVIEEDGLTECPFTLEEVVKFYSKMEETSELFEDHDSGLGRSFGWAKICNDRICQKRGRYDYVVKCKRRFARLFRVRQACLICQKFICGHSITIHA